MIEVDEEEELMSGKRMKKLRREIYGDDATNAAARQYEPTKMAKKMVSHRERDPENPKRDLWVRRLLRVFAGLLVRANPNDRAYKAAKRRLSRGH